MTAQHAAMVYDPLATFTDKHGVMYCITFDAVQPNMKRAGEARRNRRSAPRISKAKRARIFARDDHRCIACNATDDLTIDHIEHWSRGGSNDDCNLRTLCRACNSSRGSGYLAGVDR